MFVKLTRSGPRRYVQLAESFRDESGKVRQRTIASLGRLELIDEKLDSIVRGLHRVTGRPLAETTECAAPEIGFAPARTLGDCWVLDSLWRELGFDRLSDVLDGGRRRVSAAALLRVMVFNRLCDPESRLGVLRWLERTWIAGIDSESITHQQLLRAMDTLMAERDAVDALLATLLRPLIDTERWCFTT